MRKIITLLFLAAFCICSQAYSQNRADELMKQAQESLAKKEYIKARYLFLQAYNAFSSQAKYDKAVECGVNASALYHRENYYKEAFELLRGAELLVTDGEQKSGKTMPDLRFRINKERLQMYINLKNPARAKEQLVKLEETAKAAKNDSLNNDLLYTQANYYYTFGMNSQGDAYINRLISQYGEGIELILSNNDEMALGAVEAYRKAGYEPSQRPVIFGIDGLDDALEAIKDGEMQGTVYNDKEDQALQIAKLAYEVFKGEQQVRKELKEGRYYVSQYQQVDSSNVEEFLDR